jgi:aminomethyltransferase
MALRTPLYAWHIAHGARMVEFGGWDMPIQYTTIVEEHQAVRTGAGLFDISHMGRLVFEGEGALDFIQHLWTNDAATMKPGQVRYGLVCNEQGGILDDVLVYRLAPFWLMVVNASNREKILAWISRHQVGRNVRVTDRTFDWGMLAVQGPQALPTDPKASGLPADPRPLRYYFAEGTATPSGVGIVSRTGYTGEDGYEVIVPAGDLVRLVETIQKQSPHVKPCGLGARDTLRLEAAMPLYGHELNESIDPLQAGVGWAVKLDKGPFLGQDALRRKQQDASRRVRVGLELAGRRIGREGAAVLAGTQTIGQVTSGTFAPTLNKAIAMAYLDPAYAAAGTDCAVDVRGKAEPATVVSLPFYRRPKRAES